MCLQGADFYWGGSAMANCLVYFYLFCFLHFIIQDSEAESCFNPTYLCADYFYITK